MKARLFILCFGLLTSSILACSSVFGREFSPEIQALVKEMEKFNVYTSEYIGDGASPSEEYKVFRSLLAIATKDDWITLTRHKDPVICCYAFEALASDSSFDLFSLIAEHLNDTRVVHTLSGCLGSEGMTGDAIVSTCVRGYFWNDHIYIDRPLVTLLDSALIHSSSPLEARWHALQYSVPKEQFYTYIRDLASKQENLASLIALAKFRKASDVPIILASSKGKRTGTLDGNAFYWAVCEYPAVEFFPRLRTDLAQALSNGNNGYDYRYLYKAIASFRNDEARELLLTPFTDLKDSSQRSSHNKVLFEAVRDANSDHLDDVLWELWSDYHLISPIVYDHLSKRSPDSAYEFTIKTLRALEAGTFTFSFEMEEDTAGWPPHQYDEVIPKMFRLVMDRDLTLARELMSEIIEWGDISLFERVAEVTTDLKDTALIEPMFSRLADEENPHVFLKLVVALKNYEDPAINQRIVETSAANYYMNKPWWTDSLATLLRPRETK